MTPKIIHGKKRTEKERLSLYLPPTLANKIAIISAVDAETVNQTIVQLLKEAVAEVDMEEYLATFASLDDEDEAEDEEEEEEEEEEDEAEEEA